MKTQWKAFTYCMVSYLVLPLQKKVLPILASASVCRQKTHKKYIKTLKNGQTAAFAKEF